MNGQSKETFASMPAETQRITLFEYAHGSWEALEEIKKSIAQHAEDRKQQFVDQSAICKKRFVKRSHLLWMGICALCFGLGAGWLTVEQVLAIVR